MSSTTFGRPLTMLLSDPFEAVRRGFDRDFNGNGSGHKPVRQPSAPLALWEHDQQIHLEIDVPGISRDDLDLTVEDGKLLIRGERQVPQRDGRRWHEERCYGPFERIVALPDTIDLTSIEASLDDGVLFVTLSKKREAQPHQIEVKVRDSAARR